MRDRIFEDFVPVSDNKALITTGHALGKLTSIELARYFVTPAGQVKVVDEPRPTLAAGQHLRLGGRFDGKLIYSDRALGIVGARCAFPTAHQPFVHQGKLYYTDFVGRGPNVKIYCDGTVFQDHFDGHIQVGNPCWDVYGNMYFEARRDPSPHKPQAWDIWQRNSAGVLRLVGQGANPACFGEMLYFGRWNGRSFDYQQVPIAALGHKWP